MTLLGAGNAVAYGPLLLAIPIAVAAGLVSFLSPCCLPLVPGYLAYVTGTAGADAQTTPGGPDQAYPKWVRLSWRDALESLIRDGGPR